MKRSPGSPLPPPRARPPPPPRTPPKSLRLADRLVTDGGPVGLPARDAVHAAARVRGARAVVEALDRSPIVRVPGRRPHAEQLIHGELAVEDVPADQPQ